MKKYARLMLGSICMVAASAAFAGYYYGFLPWKWKNQTSVYWNVSGISSQWQDTFAAALQKWNNVPYANLSLYLGSGNDVVMDSGLGNNVLGKFEPNTCWYDSSSLCNGSKIKISTIYSFSHGTSVTSGTYDAQWLTLHESGHSLGLAHPDSSVQIMYGSIAPATVKRTLQSGDIAGFQFLYP